jgi:hypothetical protein
MNTHRIREAAKKNRRVRLSLETLEDRCVPAVFNVNSLADLLNPGPGIVTLRSAIQKADTTPGGNTINLTVPGTYQITLRGTARRRRLDHCQHQRRQRRRGRQSP